MPDDDNLNSHNSNVVRLNNNNEEGLHVIVVPLVIVPSVVSFTFVVEV